MGFSLKMCSGIFVFLLMFVAGKSPNTFALCESYQHYGEPPREEPKYHHYHHTESDYYRPAPLPYNDRPILRYTTEIPQNLPTNTIVDLEYVEDDPTYPYEDIRNFLKNNHILRQYFAAEKPLAAPAFAVSGGVDLGMRNGVPQEQEETICKIRNYKVLHPKRLKNIQNQWKTIINIQNEYEQGVEIKACVGENRACSYMDSLPFGITSYCFQNYLTKELMVFNSTTAFDLFRFPSCCVCKIKKNVV